MLIYRKKLALEMRMLSWVPWNGFIPGGHHINPALCSSDEVSYGYLYGAEPHVGFQTHLWVGNQLRSPFTVPRWVTGGDWDQLLHGQHKYHL